MTSLESATQPHRKRILIVSAHEGAMTWSALMRFIDASSAFEIESFHEFDDAYYRSAKSGWQRILLRLRTFIVFPLRFLFRASSIGKRFDAVVVVTSPFYMPILAAKLMRGARAKLIFLLNDIYPEALVAKGLLRRDGFPERTLKRLMMNALMRSDAVVFIAPDHRAVFPEVPAQKAHEIPVSGHSDPFIGHRVAPFDGDVALTYCGTLGLMHGTQAFLEWLATGDVSGLKFAFYTSGASKLQFEKAAERIARDRGVTCLHLAGPLAEMDWARIMKQSHIGLVFQDPGAGKVIFPSKVASMLVAGQAVLAVAETDSALAQLILQHDCGWIIDPAGGGFDHCIREVMHGETLLRKRRNAQRLGQERFAKEAIARRWLDLFARVTNGQVD